MPIIDVHHDLICTGTQPAAFVGEDEPLDEVDQTAADPLHPGALFLNYLLDLQAQATTAKVGATQLLELESMVLSLYQFGETEHEIRHSIERKKLIATRPHDIRSYFSAAPLD